MNRQLKTFLSTLPNSREFGAAKTIIADIDSSSGFLLSPFLLGEIRVKNRLFSLNFLTFNDIVIDVIRTLTSPNAHSYMLAEHSVVSSISVSIIVIQIWA